MAKIIVDPATYFHGNLMLLNEYVEKAAECGADFMKLQLFSPKHLAAAKWKEKIKFYEHNHISDALLVTIKDLSAGYGMDTIATVTYTDAVRRCNAQGIKNIKIASGQIIEPLIASITEFKWKRIFVSTGMLDDAMLPNALQMITWLSDVTDELIVMHCVSLYPTEYSEAKLNRIDALRNYFAEYPCSVTMGLSDHSYDTLPSIMSLGMGVKYIERHFQIPGAFGPTIEVASDMEELSELCGIAHRQDLILGKCDLKMCPRERDSIEHYQGRYLV